MNIGVVGLGLIGGSLAKAFCANTEHSVFGFDIAKSEIYAALLVDAIHAPLDEQSIGSCDVIILCTYPQGVVQYVTGNAALIKQGALVVDCSGVKREICEQCEPIARAHGFEFVGGHPMAGRQFSGFGASVTNLFDGATMILTPHEETSIATRETARDLFLSAGFGKVHFTSPDEHDKKVAFTSQLAHVVSNAYIKSPTLIGCEDLAAGSFRDMTRVARLNAPMWTQLFLENADYLNQELSGLIEHLVEYQQAIAQKDYNRLEALLKDGNTRGVCK